MKTNKFIKIKLSRRDTSNGAKVLNVEYTVHDDGFTM